MASSIEFKGVKRNPFATEELRKTTDLMESFIRDGQQIKGRLRPDQPEAWVTIKTPNEVARVMLISDLHFGSEASDLKMIEDIMRE